MAIYKKIFSLLILIPLFSACSVSSGNSTQDISENLNSSDFEQILIDKEIELYEKVMENDNIEKIDLTKLKSMVDPTQNNELIYFGRSTCIYCRKLILENEKNIENSNTKILYIDTESLNTEEKKELENFQVEEVPSFIKISKELEYVKIDTGEFEKRINNE